MKLLFDRSEKFYGESGDMMVSYFKVGAKKDGTITAVDMKNIFANYQCTPGIEHFLENTRIPNLRCTALTADVSKGSGLVGPMRTAPQHLLPDPGVRPCGR